MPVFSLWDYFQWDFHKMSRTICYQTSQCVMHIHKTLFIWAQSLSTLTDFAADGAPGALRRRPASAAGHPGPVRHRPEAHPGARHRVRGDPRQHGPGAPGAAPSGTLSGEVTVSRRLSRLVDDIHHADSGVDRGQWKCRI